VNHFSLSHFEQGGDAVPVPDAADVRSGVTYGPASSLTGTATTFAAALETLDTLNASDFETSERTALDSFYERSGVDVDYLDSDGGSTRVKALIVDTREVWDTDGESRVRLELLQVMVRRYNGVAAPVKGDGLVMLASHGTRRYRLSQSPTEAAGQLEWELEFSRTLSKARGGADVVPYR
jgi:hypothetical protein